MKKRSSVAAGPLGPLSTFSTRRGQKVRSALAVLAACREVLEPGGDRPSIANVLAVGGFSESTLHRKRYKPILHAAQVRFDARGAGEWTEGDEDWFSSMEAVAAEGYWVVPTKPTLPTDEFENASKSLSGPDESMGGLGLEPPTDRSPHGVENAELRARVAALEAEVQRRDDQLYHAVQTCQLFSRTIRMLRGRIAKLDGEIDTLQTEPWDPREQGTWRDEEGKDEEWPENQ
jgi:hypothetical protein